MLEPFNCEDEEVTWDCAASPYCWAGARATRGREPAQRRATCTSPGARVEAACSAVIWF